MHARYFPRNWWTRLGVGLVACLVLGTGSGTSSASNNALIDGMLRLMENAGFLDRDELPMGVPYLPSANAVSPFAFSNLAPPAGTAIPGLNPFSNPMPLSPMTGGGFSGLAPPGGTWPGIPWTNMPQGPGQFSPQTPGWPGMPTPPVAGLLDGVWELNRGGVVIIRADAARLYVTRDRSQDYLIRYDDTHFWWRPRDGSQFERYRYRMEEGRMVLADEAGNLLLLRRRR